MQQGYDCETDFDQNGFSYGFADLSHESPQLSDGKISDER